MYKKHSIKRGLLFILTIVLLTTFFTVGLVVLYSVLDSPTYDAFVNNSNLLTFTMHMVCFIFPSLLYILIFIPKGQRKDTLRLNSFSLRNFMYVVIILLLLEPLITLVSYISSMFFYNVSADILEEAMQIPFILSMLLIGVMPAISEELIFRGVLLSNCRDDKDAFYSLLNGFLFGVIHGNFSQFFFAFILGVVFYYVVKISNSFYLAVVAHFLINGSQVILMYITYAYSNPSELAAAAEATTPPEVVIFLLGTCFISTLILPPVFKGFARYNNYNPKSATLINLELNKE